MSDAVKSVTVNNSYMPLVDVLIDAINQAQSGKGHERHAVTQGVFRPFDQQPICEIGRMAGVGFNIGRAMKKAHEACELSNDRAVAELLGAIVYLAAAVMLIREREE